VVLTAAAGTETYLCQKMLCKGPTMDSGRQAQLVKGKPWIVYIHGGEWAECTNINEYYAMFASRSARTPGRPKAAAVQAR
jgi:hypothetical protein